MNTTEARKRFRVALSFPRGQRDYVEKVETLIDTCGYHRRDQELADARAVLG